MTQKPPVADFEQEDNGYDPDDVDPDGLASVILIEKGDDIASICGRVDTAPTFAVVLHAPDGNRPLSGELGMRRLQRHADESGKVVAIATPSLSLSNRARQVGIPVARRPEHIRWDAGGKRVLRFGSKSVVLPALGIWIQLLTIAAVLVVAIGLALTMAPSVDVRAVPPTESLTRTVRVTASPDFAEVDLEALRVPAQQISVTRTVTLAQRTTGTVLVGTVPATVAVTITNPTDREFTLPAGTVLLAGPDFIAFTIAEEVTLGPGETVEQQATAAEPGVEGNVPENTVTGWLEPAFRELTVTNPAAAAGGASEERPAVDAADLAALNQLATDLESSAYFRALIAEERPHDAVFLSTAEVTAEPGTPSHNIGEPTDVVLIDVEIRTSALAILEETLDQVAREVLGQGLTGEFVPGSVIAEETGPSTYNPDDNSVTAELRLSGLFARNVTSEDIANAVKGKSPEDAKSILAERYGIQEADVDLSPGWAPWLPRFDFRIDVELRAQLEEEDIGGEPATEANGTDEEPTPTPGP